MIRLPLKIINTGFYVPPKIETAAELAERVGKSADWIISHTGVERRHIAEESMESMAAKAAERVLERTGRPDLLINASVTPLQLIPDSSVFILRTLGFDDMPCCTIHATCLSFLVALLHAAALLNAETYHRILIVSSEKGSVSRNHNEPESAVLIGDGAAAALLERTPDGEQSELLAWQMSTWPEGAKLTEIRGFGNFRHPNNPDTQPEDNLFHMDGPATYRFAKRRVIVLVKQLLRSMRMTAKDIDLIVPHQASGPALAVLPRLGFVESRMINIVAKYGNCAAASLPMALAYAQATGRLQRGDRILLLGTGAGFSAAGAILRW
jgi:3-oxoacyl-[acyl-carrier-protein] synthase-3